MREVVLASIARDGAGGPHAESPAPSPPWHRRGTPIARFPRDLSTMLGRPSHPAN
jgi:hypothetical protein